MLVFTSSLVLNLSNHILSFLGLFFLSFAGSWCHSLAPSAPTMNKCDSVQGSWSGVFTFEIVFRIEDLWPGSEWSLLLAMAPVSLSICVFPVGLWVRAASADLLLRASHHFRALLLTLVFEAPLAYASKGVPEGLK